MKKVIAAVEARTDSGYRRRLKAGQWSGSVALTTLKLLGSRWRQRRRWPNLRSAGIPGTVPEGRSGNVGNDGGDGEGDRISDRPESAPQGVGRKTVDKALTVIPVRQQSGSVAFDSANSTNSTEVDVAGIGSPAADIGGDAPTAAVSKTPTSASNFRRTARRWTVRPSHVTQNGWRGKMVISPFWVSPSCVTRVIFVIWCQKSTYVLYIPLEPD